MPVYIMQRRGMARIPLHITLRHGGLSNMSVNSRMFSARDCVSLGSKPLKPSNQRIHPTKQIKSRAA